MQHVSFNNEPNTRKLAGYFLWLQLGALILVFGLIALDLQGLALSLSCLTFFVFVGVVGWLY